MTSEEETDNVAIREALLLFRERTEGGDRMAYALLEPLARAGLAPAQILLGWMREVGRGCDKDLHLAEELYRAAAEQDYPSAQFCLGKMYQGRGDQELAAAEFMRAAKHSFAPAYFSLAMAEVRRNGENDEAIRLLELARREGHLPSAIWLAGTTFRGNYGLVTKGKALVEMLFLFFPWMWLRRTNRSDPRVLT